MIDAVQVLWSPAGVTMPSLGTMALVDITDGDTPNIRMPVRMLSVDTPEVTARTAAGAERVDEKFAQLAQWIDEREDVPITARYADYLLPKIRTAHAGTLQFEQGGAASQFAKDNAAQRLTKPDGTQRPLFVRTADSPFDDNGRLLAYVAPNYSRAEREVMTRAQRSTFNLDMVRSGWAAPFVIYPSVPGELDLPIFLGDAADARAPDGESGRTPRRCSPTSTARSRSSTPSPRRSSTARCRAIGTPGGTATARTCAPEYCTDPKTISRSILSTGYGFGPRTSVPQWRNSTSHRHENWSAPNSRERVGVRRHDLHY
ncbi:hypothetical protein [Rhodococcus koreensis]